MISRRLGSLGTSPDGFLFSFREGLIGLRRYHAWESLAMGYLGELSPYKIRTVESSFNRMVRP